uniref:Uncharacterized protein n=1 Tax=Dulem virus 35 TaxID=3145753 RepID=A0AAU8AYL5_9CAUD
MMKIIKWMKNLFALKCPDCGGKLRSEFFDMEINNMVYKCDRCGKEWI